MYFAINADSQKLLEIVGISIQLFAGFLLALDPISPKLINWVGKIVKIAIDAINSDRKKLAISLVVPLIAVFSFWIWIAILNTKDHPIGLIDSIRNVLMVSVIGPFIYLNSLNYLADPTRIVSNWAIQRKYKSQPCLLEVYKDNRRIKLITHSNHKLLINVFILAVSIIFIFFSLTIIYLNPQISTEIIWLRILIVAIIKTLIQFLLISGIGIAIMALSYIIMSAILAITRLRFKRIYYLYIILTIWFIGGILLLISAIIK
jgi:hypothetical protein